MALVLRIRGMDIPEAICISISRRQNFSLFAHMNSPNPYIAFDLSDLAPLCAQRVGRLRAKDWSTPAERDLLREDTALLLDAVAQQLGTSNGSTQPADAITLGELVNSIEYGPLSNGRRTQVDGGRRSR